MNKVIQRIAAGTLAFGLLLGCSGCGSFAKETVRKESPTEVTVSGTPVSPHLLKLPNLTAAPEYPEMPQCPREEDYPEDYQQFCDDQWEWEKNLWQYLTDSPENAHDLDPFLKEAMKQFLSGEENLVCAPLNIYFALALLAQTAGGNSRQQILDTLGHNSIESLREQARQLWKAHYLNDGQTISLMANSVWLDEHYTFHKDTLDTLATEYFASVFTGDLGTQEMDKQLAAWLNSQTGGLLAEYTQDIQLDPATVFCLASTACLYADWGSSFSESATEEKTFHAKDRIVITDFMHKSIKEKDYYWGDDFGAIYLSLSGDHKMWLILPDKGSSPQVLLEQGDYYDMISDPYNWEDSKGYTVHLSIPKFDISSEQELIPGLNAMGITDICDPTVANYSPITQEPLYLGSTQHAARVSIDEEGIIAATYTLMTMAPTSRPPEKLKEIDFTLDRPFLFAITGKDNLPLFAGVVAEP